MLTRRWREAAALRRRPLAVTTTAAAGRCTCDRRRASTAAAPRLSTNLSCGLVGLPNVGKSTIFNALTSMSVPAENYPFCTIEPHVGVVEVPDPRLEPLSQLAGSKRTVPAAMQFVDIAGLVAGASTGAGMGNAFLQNIRDVDAILHLVRCFDSPDVVRADGEVDTIVDPAADAAVIDTELLLADLQTVERALGKLKGKRGGSDAALGAALGAALEGLEAGVAVRELEPEHAEHLQQYNLLTAKPMLFLANVGLGDEGTRESNEHVAALHEHSGGAMVSVCAVLEEELGQLEDAEEVSLAMLQFTSTSPLIVLVIQRREFLGELGLAGEEDLALGAVVREAYKLLQLQTFFTCGPAESRAWRVRRGADASGAASVIHTDIGRNLVKAEVVSYDVLVEAGGWAEAKALGQLRTEAKDYLVQDGDVCHFLHSG